MNLIFRNITVGELESLINSEEYLGFDFVPISQIRALSYMRNPRTEKTDYCLFLAYDSEKLIGYLGALADHIFIHEKANKVFWISCMWVLPECRRHGIALKLLQHSYQLYHGQLLITNYIPRSKAAFDKTGMFSEYASLSGIRGYVRFDLENILTRKHIFFRKSAFLLKLTDVLLNLPVWLKLKINLANFYSNCKVENIKYFDEKLSEFIRQQTINSTFRRGVEEFEWIRNFPWVKWVNKISADAAKYYFSQEAKDFTQWFVKLEKNEKIIGFIILTLHKGELKTPYLFYDEKYISEIALVIGRMIIQNKVKTYISHDEKINKILKESGLFLFVRKSEHGFLITNVLKQKLVGTQPMLFEGDGDGAFT